MLGVSASELFSEYVRVAMLMIVRIILDIYRLMFTPRRSCRWIRRGSLFSRSRMNGMGADVPYDTESL
jgi:hypothetical protein